MVRWEWMHEEELPVGMFPATSLESKSILALKAINAGTDNVQSLLNPAL